MSVSPHTFCRREHKCLLTPCYSPHTEHLRQLSGSKLAKFVAAIEFCSPRQKVRA